MALIDKLRRAGGIIKNRAVSAVGALRTQARGLSVRVPRALKLTARAVRLTSPLGLGITAVSFAPQIRKGLIIGRQALTRGVAFFGGQKVAVAAGAGVTVGVLGGRKEGRPTRPSDDPRAFEPKRPPRKAAKPRRRLPVSPTERRAPTKRRKKRKVAPARRPAKRRKRATHRSPRHKGHKRVSFTTKTGQKVSFLVNPKARHR